jgi:hypothetical protein
MLKPEQAEKELEKVKIKDWNDKRVREVGKLPSNLARPGRFILGRDPVTGKQFTNWMKRDEVQRTITAELTKLKPAERTRLFATLFPHLGDTIEAAWQMCVRLPYEIDYDRKGFRAPGDEMIARQARWLFLERLVEELDGYDPNPSWLAAWAPHLSEYGTADAIGLLLAAAIDKGGQQGQEVYDTLIASINRSHPIGQMGRHVTRALLVASKPEGWDAIEKLLLAAQRQEGLRQAILETVDEAHPEAFRRMVKLIREHDLLRFSSAVRAAMVWFGMGEVMNDGSSRFKKAFDLILNYFDDPAARTQAIAKGKGDEVYFALWVAGYEDVTKAIPLAAGLLNDKDTERRFLAVEFLKAVQLPASRQALVPALDDEDLRIALRAFEGYRYDPEGGEPDGSVFEILKKLIDRMPAKSTDLKPIGPEKERITADVQEVIDELPDHLGKRSREELLPYIPRMSGYRRAEALVELSKTKPLPARVRELLFQTAGDRDSYVRSQVLDALKKLTLTTDEATLVEGLLTRKSADLREQVLLLLVRQKPDDAVASADRLLAAKNANQRMGGLELLRQMVAKKKGVAACRERAQAYQEAHPEPDEHEQSHLDAILDVKREVPTLENALGLLDPAQLTPTVAPKKKSVQFITSAGRAIITELDQFITDNAEEMVQLDDDNFDEDDEDEDDLADEDEEETNPQQLPLGSITYELPDPDWNKKRAEDLKRMPLRNLLTQWAKKRPAKLRDSDGLELIRARCIASLNDYLFNYPGGNKKSAPIQKAMKTLLGGLEKPIKTKNDSSLIGGLLGWLIRLEEPAGNDFLLDAAETSLALVPDEILNKKIKKDSWGEDWRQWNLFEFWPGQLQSAFSDSEDSWTREQKGRYYRLRHWLERPAPHMPRQRMDWTEVEMGYELGLANLADLTEQLLGPRPTDDEEDTFVSVDFDALEWATRPPPTGIVESRPEVASLVERVRQRILEVEFTRGELPTAATGAARALESVYGLDLLCRLLSALGARGFDRRDYGETRAAVFTRLVKRCFPTPEDTPEAFAERMRDLVKRKVIAADVPLQLAFINPRWVFNVEHYLGLTGLSEAVWWFFAHMPFETPNLPESLEKQIFEARKGAKDIPDPWEVMVHERTTLSDEDREEGAVDTAWFQRVFNVVGPKRWQELMDACKFACNDNSYRNAMRLADVLRGKGKRNDLIREVRVRKLKESVRLLGLMPLATGDKREADLQQRWKAIAEYRKYARGLSPLSREDAIRTGEIGLANLARTAGYADPNRLVWAMEWNEIQDLAGGPIVAKVGDVTVSLALDDQAQPVLTVQRGEHVLKAVPPKVRKQKAVATLLERRTALKQQASRIRYSLEAMMIRGDTFRGDELPELLKHPLVARNLTRLLILGEGIAGYPVANGKALEDHAGKKEPVKKDEVLRLAHPLDLLASKDWHNWQAHLFRIERVQPFKQVFRELYVVTQAERADKTFSQRYSGQQVNPRQAMALFGSRGWRTSAGVTKTFSEQDLVAEVEFQSGVGTPLEVEGLTLDRVHFHRRGEWAPLPLADIPGRLFSEVMRDLDLVVSVAHVGGVDPEASASTMQMRASLASELCSLLNIKNVKVKEPHLLIDGQLAKYSLHLGSGTVHKMPGGALCIVSVPAQHRGRLFLPFADDDPRTAEVIAKLLLLARDDEIQDPGILDQLRR